MATATGAKKLAAGTGKTDMSAAHGAALRRALQPLNGLRVISAVQIMVRAAPVRDCCYTVRLSAAASHLLQTGHQHSTLLCATCSAPAADEQHTPASVLCAALQVFHHMMLRPSSSDELNDAFSARPATTSALLAGNLGLDTLFLISAFLATLALVPALEQARGSTWQVSTQLAESEVLVTGDYVGIQ